MDFIKGNVDAAIFSPVGGEVSEMKAKAAGAALLSGGVFDGLAAALTSMGAIADQAEAHMAAKLQSIKTQLPIMAAADRAEKAASVLSGMRPGTNGGASFTNAFKSVTDLAPAMASANSAVQAQIEQMAAALPPGVTGATPLAKLAAFAATAPAQKITDPENPGVEIDNPEYAAFTAEYSSTIAAVEAGQAAIIARVASEQTGLDGMISGEASAVAAGVTALKNQAFASFAAGAQPPSVRAVLDKFMPSPGAETHVSKDLLSGAQSSIGKAASRAEPIATVPINAEAIVAVTPTPAVTVQAVSTGDMEMFNELMTENYVTLSASTTALEAMLDSLKARKLELNYDAVKQAALDNPGDAAKQQAHQSMKASFIQEPAYMNYDAKAKEHNAAMASYRASKSVFHRYRDGGCPAGLTAGQKSFGTITIHTLTANTA